MKPAQSNLDQLAQTATTHSASHDDIESSPCISHIQEKLIMQFHPQTVHVGLGEWGKSAQYYDKPV